MQRCIPGLVSNVGQQQQHQQQHQQTPGYPNASTVPLNQYRQHVPNNRTDTSDSLASINNPMGGGGQGAVPYSSYMTTGRHDKLPAKLPMIHYHPTGKPVAQYPQAAYPQAGPQQPPAGQHTSPSSSTVTQPPSHHVQHAPHTPFPPTVPPTNTTAF